MSRDEHWIFCFVVWAVALPACGVDIDVPKGALLLCNGEGQCPTDWACQVDAGVCAAPNDTRPFSAWAAGCLAIYEKSATCEQEIRAGMKDAALFVYQPSSLFVQSCVARVATQGNAEQQQMLQGISGLLPGFTCEQFVGGLGALGFL